jgi:integrase
MWLDAVGLWLKNKPKKNTIEDDKDKLRWLLPHLSKLKLQEIDSNVINKIRDEKLKDGVSDITINRYLALIRAILNMAKANEMMETVPSFKGKMAAEDKERVVYMTRQQANKLYEYLPKDIKSPYKFALLTGLRKANVFNLQWSSIDLERGCAWVAATDAKGKKSITIPLNPSAIELLKISKANHPLSKYAFGGVKPLELKAWRRVTKQSGVGEEILADFGVELRWHDLRHTWATWHVMGGTPLAELQRLGGWQSYAMVLKYAHFAPAHLAKYSNNSEF